MKSPTTHTDRAAGYVRDVLAGKFPTCTETKQACQRHLDDLARSAADPAWPYRYDEYLAGRVCRFVELLPHVMGRWARKDPRSGNAPTISLEPWQCFILCSLFGWVRKDAAPGTRPLRRFRRGSVYVARKNGKSTLGAGTGLYMLVGDGEPGAEVYAGATSETQAKILHGFARRMVKAEPELQAHYGIQVFTKLILTPDGSKFEPIIGKPGDGASPHCALIDEYHEHDTDHLRDTMETGMGAREQPVSLIISTAGTNLASPCRADWLACQKLLAGTPGFEDDQKFAIIYTLDDPENEWMTEDGLRKANPCWGVSVMPGPLLADMRVAMRDPRAQNRFKTKHCNVWASAKSAYYNMLDWAKCIRPGATLGNYKGSPCILAADFAAKNDLVSLIILFILPDRRFAVFAKNYLPRAAVERPENQHYRTWEAEGRLTVTEGNVTDIDALIEDAIEIKKSHEVTEFPIDPTRAYHISTTLQKEGFNMIEFRGNASTISTPMKHLADLMADGKIEHDGDPVLEWAISNVVGMENRRAEVYPNKETPAQKIDPAVSLLYALSRAMFAPPVARGGGFAFA